MAWPVLVFDIETIPDVESLLRFRPELAQTTPPPPDQPAASAPVVSATADLHARVWAAWQAERLAQGKSEMVPLHWQRVLCISCVFRSADGLKVRSFVDRDGSGEGAVIQQFFNAIERHSPQLVSWNGGGFDLPVLHYRGLKHGVVAPRYWDMGDGGDHDSREFKWNNYISRYHTRHLDLMDLLAMYQPKNNAPLDAMAKLCGFPGKLGMDGSAVYPSWLRGETESIRQYCETDVLNTYLLYCRFQTMRGGFTSEECAQEMAFVRQTLQSRVDAPPVGIPGEETCDPESHWREYLAAWA